MTMEYCEFNSAELLAMARKDLANARQLMRLSPKLSDDCLMSVGYFLEQAEQQLIHNKGEAYLPPEPKDPWAWEDPDTFCPA